MLYAMLIFAQEDTVDAVAEDEMAARVQRHVDMQKKLKLNKQLGPFARLMPTSTAITIRASSGKPVIMDGPFAETKERLLGFYLVQSESLEELAELAKSLPLEDGSIEIRPVRYHELHTPG